MNKDTRVVITGIGVVAPNGVGVSDFKEALKAGRSGIRFFEEGKDLNLRCQVGGQPIITDEYKAKWLPDFFAQKLSNKGVIYACLSGMEAWKDAGLELNEEPDLDTGMVFGAGDLSFDSFLKEFPSYPIDRGESKKLGSRTISECMNSGAAAYLNNLLGVGNRVMSNSAACITGSESLLLGYEHIVAGRAKRMICGSTEGDGRYIWSGFDAMRVLCSDSNDRPEYASRPMSASSSGFAPAGGSGAMVIETLESAQERGAKIYAEILGGAANTGGQRNGGTMTAPNSSAVIACIRQAVKQAGIKPSQIDLISGHLTSTKGDPIEVANWKEALELSGEDFPMINTPKCMIGHCIGGAGSVELVASVLQLDEGFIHPQINCENVHPEIEKQIPLSKIPKELILKDIQIVAKSNFGFGDLNCVMILKKWTE